MDPTIAALIAEVASQGLNALVRYYQLHDAQPDQIEAVVQSVVAKSRADAGAADRRVDVAIAAFEARRAAGAL